MDSLAKFQQQREGANWMEPPEPRAARDMKQKRKDADPGKASFSSGFKIKHTCEEYAVSSVHLLKWIFSLLF